MLLQRSTAQQLAFQGPSDPTPADDLSAGYENGMRWLNTLTKRVWVIADDSVGAAVWREDTPSLVADFDKIVVAKYTRVYSVAPEGEYDPMTGPTPLIAVTAPAVFREVPLVVISNAGNVVMAL